MLRVQSSLLKCTEYQKILYGTGTRREIKKNKELKWDDRWNS